MDLPILAAMAMISSSAVAASPPDGDLRCLLVAHGFAAVGKTDAERRVAALSEAFYLGRVSARLPAGALPAAIRAQGRGVQAAEAGRIMTACAAGADRAGKRLVAAARQASAK